MNLVLSGPIEPSLLDAVEHLVKPWAVTTPHKRCYRFEGIQDSGGAHPEIARLCGGAYVDHAFVRANVAFSALKLLAIDMDSTLINIECIDEMADYAGKRREVADITAAAMSGELPDFESSLKMRVALLAGLDLDVLEKVYNERLELNPGAKRLMTRAKACGQHCLLLSGGFSYFANRIGKLLRFDEIHANCLDVRDNVLSGSLKGKIVDGTQKAAYVKQALSLIGSSPDDAIVIGDGSNDVEMMATVKTSVAFHAKAKVKSTALYRIDFGGLDTVLDYLDW